MKKTFLILLTFVLLMYFISAYNFNNPIYGLQNPQTIGGNITNYYTVNQINQTNNITNNITNEITIYNTTNHNDLLNIQGGADGEYYHLNQADYEYIIANLYLFSTNGSGSGGLGNQSWNESFARTLFADINTIPDNVSWNEELANSLYAPIWFTGGNASWNESYARQIIEQHTSNLDNPHNVTAEQVYKYGGTSYLGETISYIIDTMQGLIEGLTTIVNNQGDQIDNLTIIANNNSDLIISHINNYSNPHQTTALQVGAVSINGTETIYGIKTFNSFPLLPSGTPDNVNSAISKQYADDTYLLGLDWKNAVVSANKTSPPISPNVGDRYIVGVPATGIWTGYDNRITTWNGTNWDMDGEPQNGWAVLSLEDNFQYRYDGALSSWVKIGSSRPYLGGDGITILNSVVNVSLANNSGLIISGNRLNLSIDGAKFIISNGRLELKTLSINNSDLLGGITDNKLNTITTANKVSWGAVNKTGSSINDLDDVTITTPTTNDCLKYDGSKWVNSACPSGGGGSSIWANATVSNELTLYGLTTTSLNWTMNSSRETPLSTYATKETYYKKGVDLSSVTFAKINVYHYQTNLNGAFMYMQYSTDGITWSNLSSDNTGIIPLSSSASTIAWKTNEWNMINPSARNNNVTLRAVASSITTGGVIIRGLSIYLQSPISGNLSLVYINQTNNNIYYVNQTMMNYTAQSYDFTSYAGYTWTSMPNLTIVEPASNQDRLVIPLSSGEWGRFVLSLSSYCNPTGFIYEQYSVDSGATWNNISANNNILSCNATGGANPRYSDWDMIPFNARTDNTWLRVMGTAGTGAVVSPVIRQIRFQTKSPLNGNYNITYINQTTTNEITNYISYNFTTTNYTYQDVALITPVTTVATTGMQWANMPLIANEFANLTAGSRATIPLTSSEYFRLVTQMSTTYCGVNGKIYLQYSSDNGATFNNLSDSATFQSCNLTGGATNPRYTSWEGIPLGARTDNTIIRIMGIGGDGVIDPSFKQIRLQTKSPMVANGTGGGGSGATYYSDENYINKNATNSFNLNVSKLNQTIRNYVSNLSSGSGGGSPPVGGGYAIQIQDPADPSKFFGIDTFIYDYFNYHLGIGDSAPSHNIDIKTTNQADATIGMTSTSSNLNVRNNGTSFGNVTSDADYNNFTNATYANVSDNRYAIWRDSSGKGQTNYIKAQGFNFNIPEGYTIDNIEVLIEAKSNAGVGIDNAYENSAYLLDENGNTVGGDISGGNTLTNTDTIYSLSSGEALPISTVNSANFGFMINYYTDSASFNSIVSIDQISINVYYSKGSSNIITSRFSDGALVINDNDFILLNGNLNITKNITANWFKGKINWSDIQNAPIFVDTNSWQGNYTFYDNASVINANFSKYYTKAQTDANLTNYYNKYQSDANLSVYYKNTTDLITVHDVNASWINASKGVYTSYLEDMRSGLVTSGIANTISVKNIKARSNNLYNLSSADNVFLNGYIANLMNVSKLCNSSGSCFTLSQLNQTSSSSGGGVTTYGVEGSLQFKNGTILNGTSELVWSSDYRMLGIGTANPATKIDVGGIIRALENNTPRNVITGTGIEIKYQSGYGYIQSNLHTPPSSTFLQPLNIEAYPITLTGLRDLVDGGTLNAPDVYNYAVGSNMRALFIDDAGNIGTVLSSEKYKTNITNLTNANWLYNLNIVNYDYKNSSMGSNETGMIAEQVDKVEPRIVSYKRVEEINCEDIVTDKDIGKSYSDLSISKNKGVLSDKETAITKLLSRGTEEVTQYKLDKLTVSGYCNKTYKIVLEPETVNYDSPILISTMIKAIQDNHALVLTQQGDLLKLVDDTKKNTENIGMIEKELCEKDKSYSWCKDGIGL